MKKTITLVTNDKPEVLVRLILLLSRRQIKIDSLTFQQKKNSKLSLIKLCLNCDDKKMHNIIVNFEKQIDVLLVETELGKNNLYDENSGAKIKG